MHVFLKSLVVPFLRFGEAITGGPRFPFTSDALKKVLTGQASREVLLSILHAVSWSIYSVSQSSYLVPLVAFKVELIDRRKYLCKVLISM